VDEPRDWPEPIIVESTGSTNADVMALCREGAPEGTSLVADEQTAGRGRLGRSWVSAPGTGLWMSVLVRQSTPAQLGLLPLVTGVAVARAVRADGVPAVLKWPNDVVVDAVAPRKLAGILCESDGSDGVVVGIGVNVSQTRDQLPVPNATSIALEAGSVTRATLLSGILVGLRECLEALRTDHDGILAAYRELCVTLGRDVEATLPSGEVIRGRAEAIAGDGRLAIRTAGNSVYVAAGDVIHATI